MFSFISFQKCRKIFQEVFPLTRFPPSWAYRIDESIPIVHLFLPLDKNLSIQAFHWSSKRTTDLFPDRVDNCPR